MSETGRHKRMPLRYVIEYALFRVLGVLVRFFPAYSAHRVGAKVGRAFYPLLTSRRRVALRNLRNAFPELSRQQIEQIAKESFESVTTSFLELMAFERFSAEDIKRQIRIENLGLLTDARRSNRGAIFLTAHFGNWELAAQAIAVYVDRPLHIIVKTQRNPLVDRRLVGWRTKFGARLIPMDNAVREVLRVLKDAEMVGLAADQAASKESISVEFFGRSVPTFAGPAAFALKTGAPLILGLAERQPDGTYIMRLAEIPSADLGEHSDEAVLELTRRQVRMTEEMIRRSPGQWMWMHKRWKHVADRPGVMLEELR